MRVLIVNTSENTGGAAVASHRLMEALNNNGIKAKMLVCDKQSDCITVADMRSKLLRQWYFVWERWCIFFRLHFSKEHLWDIDTASAGFDITKLPEFKEADIIHLAWINQGMLSLKSIRKIIESGKPVVWTMHDLWCATGICHYARDCKNFISHCGNCALLPGGGSDNDLSAKVWKRKKKLYSFANIYFVSCSKWLENEAKNSGLFVGKYITNIPNPIDIHVFCPSNRQEARHNIGLPIDKKLILFVSQDVSKERKGMSYFVNAINELVDSHPEVKENTCVVVLGGHSDEVTDKIPLPSYSLGYVSDSKRIVDVYNAVDIYVSPSLEDNLPNTIMEAMACGVPCVGFDTGGIPEMIDHKDNGYVAEYRNAADMSKGIYWILRESDYSELSKACVQKVIKNYSEHAVSKRYIEVYQKVKSLKKSI